MRILMITLILVVITIGFTVADPVLLNPQGWTFSGDNISFDEYKGQKCIHFKKGKAGKGKGRGDREAFLKDYKFKDGEISLKLAGQMFVGVVFRVQDADTYEAVYFRPQNSAYKDPVKRSHAVQYIAHPKFTWSVLRKKFPGKYEAAAKVPVDKWFKARIVVKGTRAEVYVNDEKTPCLVVKDLKHGESEGSVGFFVGAGREGWFTDLSIKPSKQK